MSLLLFFRRSGPVAASEADAYHALGAHASDFPLYLVEVAFSDGPLVVEPAWTDVSEFVRGLSVRRGRSDELARVETGTLAVVLDNRDRRFDPTYTDGPYFPNVVPMRQVRVRACWGGVAHNVYRGFVEQWPQAWPEYGKDAVVEVTAFDALGALQLAEARRAYSDLVVSHGPVGYWRLGEVAGSTAADSSGNGLDGIYIGGRTQGAGSLLAGDANPAVTFDGASYVSVPDDASLDFPDTFTVEAWVRFTVAPSTANLDYSIASRGVSPSYWDLYVENGDDKLYLEVANAGNEVPVKSSVALVVDRTYHVVCTKDGSDARIYVDGEDVSVLDTDNELPAMSEPLFIGRSRNAIEWWDGTLDEVAVYDRALSAAEVAAHYHAGAATRPAETAAERVGFYLDVAGWPSGLRDLDTGRTELSAASAHDGGVSDAIGAIAQAETGLVYADAGGTVVFADRSRRWLANTSGPAGVLGDGGGSEIPVGEIVAGYAVDSVLNHVVVTPAGGTAVTASDTASQAAYYRRSLEHAILTDDTNEAESIAAGLLGRFKDPALRIESVSLLGGSGTAIWPHVLGADLGARYTVRRRPPAGGTIETSVYLEAITHDVQPGPVWVTTWQLSPADADSYWVLEDDTFGVLDSTTRLAY